MPYHTNWLCPPLPYSALSCHALSNLAPPFPALPCSALHCPTLPYPAIPRPTPYHPALPCPALPRSYWGAIWWTPHERKLFRQASARRSGER